MIIGGLEKLTLIDYPGHLAAIVFTQGCNFRCHFCYNPMLVRPDLYGGENKEDHPLISEDGLLEFLKKRQGKLDGVVITGGEPTLHKDLPDFIKKIRKLDYKIKLDSNGTNPEMLENLIKEKLVDYFAMDIKAPLEKYEKVVGVKVDKEKIKKSIEILKKSKVPYEFRTTLVPELNNLDDIEKMGRMIDGSEKWFLQRFKSDAKLVNENFENKLGFAEADLEEMCNLAKKYVKICKIRG